MFRILPYKLSSESGKALADGLEALRINPNASTYRRRPNHRLINWGLSNTHYEGIFGPGDYNHPRAVAFATDKIVTFKLLRTAYVPVPTYTCARQEGQEWARNEKVYGRNSATASQGQGITVYNPGDTLGYHKFYVKQADNKYEYRVHIGRGRVIDVTMKRRANGHENPNMNVRSYDNGWRFCRNNIVTPPDHLIQAAKDAVRVLDLDFGAVDVCIGHHNEVCVFEVNTAPGIEGTTLTKYIEFFKEHA